MEIELDIQIFIGDLEPYELSYNNFSINKAVTLTIYINDLIDLYKHRFF